MVTETDFSASPPPPANPEGTPNPWVTSSSPAARSHSSDTNGSTRSPPLGLRQLLGLQDFMPYVRSQYRVYEDVFVKKVKDGLMSASEHPIESCGIAIASGFILFRGPRRFLIRNTLGRLKSEQDRFAEVESSLKELRNSIEKLKKERTTMLSRAENCEEYWRNGCKKTRDAGREIQRLVKSIYKIETQAADLMDGLRTLPGRNVLQLRAEVASMASYLKNQKCELDKRIMKIAEHGIRV